MALTTTFIFGGEDSASDPAQAATIENETYIGSSKIVNFDVGANLELTRREGTAMVASSPVSSAWDNGATAYCVTGQKLHTFDGESLTQIGNSPTLIGRTEFVQVNDTVVFSDSIVIGQIADGVTTTFRAPTENVDLYDLESWVQATYPAGAESGESNIEVNAFNLTTFAGRCLTFFNGALYLAVDNFIFCTRTFDVSKMDIRYNVVAGFASPVTMIRAVSDGLYVGTESGLYFLAGSGVHVPGESAVSITRAFTQKKLFSAKVFYGSAVTADQVLKFDTPAAVFATSEGIFAGGPGGDYVDMTAGKVRIPAMTLAGAYVRKLGRSDLYVVSSPEGSVAVNLSNGLHSSYEDFSFSSFFTLNGKHYGASTAGIFLLEGDGVDAYVLTPLVDFGISRQKTCVDAILQARASDVALDLYVDEVEVATGLLFRVPPEEGLKRIRAKLPRGVQGANWQFRISNVEGARLDLISLKVNPVVLSTTV